MFESYPVREPAFKPPRPPASVCVHGRAYRSVLVAVARLTVASICDMASSRRYWQVELVERGCARRGLAVGLEEDHGMGSLEELEQRVTALEERLQMEAELRAAGD